jgi:hypothetical protein
MTTTMTMTITRTITMALIIMSSSLQPLRALSFSIMIPPRPLSLSLSSTSTSTSTSSLSLLEQIQIPTLKTIPLPFKLLGGLFLFAGSVKDTDKKFSNNILQKAEEILRIDPLISMELGLGIEAGGIFASSKTTQHHYQIMIMEFQLNGGNSWAQARVCGIQKIYTPPEDGNGQEQQPDNNENEIQLISLGVANMDASLNGGWAEVKLPPITIL